LLALKQADRDQALHTDLGAIREKLLSDCNTCGEHFMECPEAHKKYAHDDISCFVLSAVCTKLRA
jgi:hypothetical protein